MNKTNVGNAVPSGLKQSLARKCLAYLGGISIIRPMVAMLLIVVLLSSAMVTRAQVRVPKETNKYIQIGAKVLGAIPNPYVKGLGGAVGFLFAAEEEPAWAVRKAELEKSWQADIADKSKEDYKTFINARKKAYLRDLDLIAIAQNRSPEEAMDQARVLAGIVRTDIPLFHENAGGKPYPARPTLPYLYAAMSLYLDLVKTQIDWAQYDLTMKIAAENAGAATVARGRRDALVEQYNKQLVVYWKTLQRETIRAKQEVTDGLSACNRNSTNPECKQAKAQIINETNSYDLADYGVYKTSFDNRAPVLYSCSIRMKKHRDYDDGQHKGALFFAQVNLVCPVPGGVVHETGFWNVRASDIALKEGGEVVPFSVNFYWSDLHIQTGEFVFKAYLSGQNPRKGYRFTINEDTTYGLAVDADDLEKSQTVTNTDDSGPGSLRQAIEDGGRINIDAIQGQTITLTSGPLYIYSRDVKIMADNLKQPVKILGQRRDKIFVVSGDAKFYNDNGGNLYNLLDVDGKDLKCGVNPSVTANAPPVTTCPGVGQ